MSTATISAADVNKLRQITGAGMMDCKKALAEANGDFEAAIDYLRKKGAKVAANRTDRDAKEGVVIAITTADGKTGVVMELNCETDFVAKNEEFVKFATNIAELALNNNITTTEALLAAQLNGLSVADRITENVGKIGEKIEISKFFSVSGEAIVAYIHGSNRMGVLVELNQSVNDAIRAAGKDVAMQIAAMNPVAVDKGDVDANTISREIEIGKDQARAEGKPEEMLEKIALGKLNKFYKDSTLLNQEFVKDSSKTISQMLNEVSNGLTVKSFKRVALGA